MTGAGGTSHEQSELLTIVLRRAAQFITDERGTILWANRSFAERFGYDSVELVGRSRDSLIGSGVDGDGHRACRRHDGAGFRAMLTRTRVRRDGATLFVWTLGRPGRALLHPPEGEEDGTYEHDNELELLRTLHELASA
jgi:PAS domain S-box-containing protein